MFNLKIMNLNHQKITYFCHKVPWTKIPDDVKRFTYGERKFQDFYSNDLKTYKVFNGMVFNVGHKGIPSRMCDSGMR